MTAGKRSDDGIGGALARRYNRAVEFRVLGPLEVVDQGRRLPLAGVRQQGVLALLLLHVNEVVATERLIDELWGDSPPSTARKALQIYVSQLRRLLGAKGQAIATRNAGYMLTVQRGDFDATRFEDLVAQARSETVAGRIEAAALHFRDALALWRGPALAGLVFDSDARAYVDRLDEERLIATMDRIDCELALGRHEQLVGELDSLVAQHPLRERLRSQLMVALYRSGRQADALAAYRDTRAVLRGELGLEPSGALQRLERAILQHDPALELPGGVASASAEPTDGHGSGERSPRRRLRLAVGAVALTLVVFLGAGAAFRLTRDDPKPEPIAGLTRNSVGLIDPDTNRLVARFQTGEPARTIAAGERFAWVPKQFRRTIRRIDRKGHAVEIGLGHSPHWAVVAFGRVWVVAIDSLTAVPSARLIALEPDAATIARSVNLRAPPAPLGNRAARSSAPRIAAGAGTIWVSSSDTVWRVDPRTFRVVAAVRVPDVVFGLAVGEGAAWASGPTVGLFRIDARTNAVATVVSKPWSWAWDLTVSNGSLWIADHYGHSLRRVDPLTGDPTRIISVGRYPRTVVVGGGSIWVDGATSVTRVDPKTNRVVATIPVRHQVVSIAWSEDGLWVLAGSLL